jgi:hypothetical protein
MADEILPGAGTPAPGAHPATPAEVAAADQHLTELRNLVQLVRDHRDAYAHACSPVLPCPGDWAWQQVARMRCHHRAGLLAMAVAELAALGYGLPGWRDRYELTDTARRHLEADGGGTDG